MRRPPGVCVVASLSPLRGLLISDRPPRLTPWAAFYRRFAAWSGRFLPQFPDTIKLRHRLLRDSVVECRGPSTSLRRTELIATRRLIAASDPTCSAPTLQFAMGTEYCALGETQGPAQIRELGTLISTSRKARKKWGTRPHRLGEPGDRRASPRDRVGDPVPHEWGGNFNSHFWGDL